MNTVLVSHFFNEEFLLPHWVQHHVKMFDHAVMIDYASTDRSVDIIKSLAPHWEIRPSRNIWFDAPLVDREVMDIEATFADSWKVALNTTEFLVMPELDLKGTLSRLVSNHPMCQAVSCHGILMVDRIEDKETPIDATQPLILQRHWGIIESPGFAHRSTRSRILHCLQTVHYEIGRHWVHSSVPVYTLDQELYCVWFGWSPYRHIKKRKMQVQTKIPPHNVARGFGAEHQISGVQHLDQVFQGWSSRAYDLYSDGAFHRVVESCRGKFPDPYVPCFFNE